MKQTILNHYKSLVKFLGECLGPDYQIILYDLTDNNRVIAICNGEISNCKIGDCLPDSDLALLKKETDMTQGKLINYPGYQKGLSFLRASSFFIKDSIDNLIGLLTINYDDSRVIDLHDRILSLAHPTEFIKEHTFHTLQNIEKTNITVLDIPETSETPTNTDNMLNNIYRCADRKLNLPSDRLTQDERIAMISILQDYGFFRLKGAVPFAAERLRCSNASIYRYLSEVKNKK